MTIEEIIQQVAEKDVHPGPDDSLFESGLLDSFALADLVAALEKEFGVKIPDKDLHPRNFDSVNKVQSYLSKLR